MKIYEYLQTYLFKFATFPTLLCRLLRHVVRNRLEPAMTVGGQVKVAVKVALKVAVKVQ